MNAKTSLKKPATVVLFVTSVVITIYMWLFLHAESQLAVAGLIAGALVATIAGKKLGTMQHIEQAAASRPGLARLWAIGGVLALTAAFYDSHFILLMMGGVLLYATACMGLTLQFGFSGVANFAGAAFFGIGSYTAAVLATHTGLPQLVNIALSGLVAAILGSVLILPVLRTRGHYAALVTIAFGILFKTFIEVNDVLGGPQGLQVPSMEIFGYQFNDGFTLFGLDVSFYVSYVLLSLVICSVTFVLLRALERSWVGLSMDVVRTDETAASTFGLHIKRWKIIAFTMGNLFAGIAGSVYGMMAGFIAPNNFTFSDSLLLLSITILGGLGNPIGLIPAALIVMILPEKFQFIQEYRVLLYAALVIAILLFRPEGLLPRKTRLFFSKGAA
ncbi:branched-chain amino acid ABC transporter permease [uncultured Oxalicibacterium sp.]|uniref:branched-chain amino acid ABC transporter permease n=1 Tax=uncultured Oxalicibacterium sp. TaxID=1168540 RepID=UPI0025F707CD|nr:branched-chain amino acid ABC transporter permease [uncultured Oxalicibacterium sp.]